MQCQSSDTTPAVPNEPTVCPGVRRRTRYTMSTVPAGHDRHRVVFTCIPGTDMDSPGETTESAHETTAA